MLELNTAGYPMSSFRSEFRQTRPGFRTPSPPRHAIESPSPARATFFDHTSKAGASSSLKRDRDTYESYWLDGTIERSPPVPQSNGWQDRRPAQRGPPPIDTRRPSNAGASALDFLATIAISPSLAPQDHWASTQYPPLSAVSGTTHQFYRPQPFERASKRSRSEVINPRPLFTNDYRPATSYTYSTAVSPTTPVALPPDQSRNPHYQPYMQQPTNAASSFAEDDVREDAELLLSISRGFPTAAARSAWPSSNAYGDSKYAQDHTYDSRQGRHPRFLEHQSPAGLSHKQLPPEPLRGQRQDFMAKLEPFEDEKAHIKADHAGAKAMAQTDGQAPTKPKDHRGWPKGKPRGPRNTGADGKKRGKAANKSDQQGTTKGSGRGKGRAQQQKQAKAAASTQAAAQEIIFDVPPEVRRPRRKSFQAAASKFGIELPSEQSRQREKSAPARISLLKDTSGKTKKPRTKREQPLDICKACKQNRNAEGGLHEMWINCNGCKAWFHIQCAGFEDEKKLKEVDKYHCDECEPEHGPTTFVRKSSRAHASVDYAGLNEGKIRTAVDVPDHHYIEPIKNGAIEFLPETFARLPPELVTREYFERCGGWTEPVLVPAALNPRPYQQSDAPTEASEKAAAQTTAEQAHPADVDDFSQAFEYDCMPDEGQDRLDMVIPEGLTVRRAAELYGPEEKVDVIDVKLQEGEDRRWSMRQWADYYEAEGAKPVRNVISLEVSQSLLGKLIRRPKVVRDLDLQDSVWPEEETAKGVFPRVQFYCLMSVADCYTDFHIDFGGSSVYYHILKGRKTFFFIPPKPKYLKKYEDWCNSPDQNSVFLGNETKECYRVDLFPGDTMLIPSGWIHAVWTPENSLVIGGNFLTRMHYGTQIAVNEIEKATNVTRKFRYPYFQKILWLTLVRYLEQDPIPSTVVDLLCDGRQFEREHPICLDSPTDEDESAEHERPPELHNARYYSQAELDGLPELIKYIYRTVMIALGKLPGISKQTQDAVIKSMPKDCGDHLEALRTFAMWTAWKRGNENIPSWAYPDAPLADLETTVTEKKLSAAAQKRIERQAMQEALNVAGARRTSSRASIKDVTAASTVSDSPPGSVDGSKTSKPVDSRRMACDACRRSKRRCTHNGAVEDPQHPAPASPAATTASRFGIKMVKAPKQAEMEPITPTKTEPGLEPTFSAFPSAPLPAASAPQQLVGVGVPSPASIRQAASIDGKAPTPSNTAAVLLPPMSHFGPPQTPGNSAQRPKSRACDACRKSKHRCTHNSNGIVNNGGQVRPSGSKRPAEDSDSSVKKVKRDADANLAVLPTVNASETAFSPQWPQQQHQVNGVPPFASTPNFAMPAPTANPYAQAPARVPLNGTSTMTPYQYLQPQQHTGAAAEAQPAANGINDMHTVKADSSGNARTSSNSTADSRSRTSSVHIHTTASEGVLGSHSPPTSPLTEPEPSSPMQPPVTNGNSTHTNGIVAAPTTAQEQTPRPSKETDHTNSTAFAANAAAPSVNGDVITPKVARRPSTASSSGKPFGIMNSARMSSAGSRKGSMHGSPGATSPPREKTQQDIEEEESIKLAKAMAMEDAGLRRRGTVKYTR